MLNNFEILLETFHHSNLNIEKKNANFNNNNKKKNPFKKKIKFSNLVRVRMIPFFYEDNQFSSLWWTPYELMDFRIHASREIMELTKKHPSICLLDAQKLLYQPNNISYDEKNFSHYN